MGGKTDGDRQVVFLEQISVLTEITENNATAGYNGWICFDSTCCVCSGAAHRRARWFVNLGYQATNVVFGALPLIYLWAALKGDGA